VHNVGAQWYSSRTNFITLLLKAMNMHQIAAFHMQNFLNFSGKGTHHPLRITPLAFGPSEELFHLVIPTLSTDYQ